MLGHDDSVAETWPRDSGCRDMLPTAHTQYIDAICVHVSVVGKRAGVHWRQGYATNGPCSCNATGCSYACETMTALLPLYTEHSGL